MAGPALGNLAGAPGVHQDLKEQALSHEEELLASLIGRYGQVPMNPGNWEP